MARLHWGKDACDNTGNAQAPIALANFVSFRVVYIHQVCLSKLYYEKKDVQYVLT